MFYKSKFLFYFLLLCYYQKTWVWREKGNDIEHHSQPSVDRGWRIVGGDLGGEGRGIGIGFKMVAGVGIVVGRMKAAFVALINSYWRA